MTEIIEQLSAKIAMMKRRESVLVTSLEAYQAGLIAPKSKHVFFATAVNTVDNSGIVKLQVPADLVGRRFRVVLDD